MAQKPKSLFRVCVHLELDASVEIPAATLELALEAARKLKEQDFVTFNDKYGFDDGDIKLRGVFEV